MADQPLIRFERVSKVYGMGETEVRALDGIDLRIDDGEFVGVADEDEAGEWFKPSLPVLVLFWGGLDLHLPAG